MEWTRNRSSIVIAGLLVLVILLVIVAGLVPLLDCPYCGPGKSRERNFFSDPYLCLCKDGRVSLIYWWKVKRGMERPSRSRNPFSPP